MVVLPDQVKAKFAQLGVGVCFNSMYPNQPKEFTLGAFALGFSCLMAQIASWPKPLKAFSESWSAYPEARVVGFNKITYYDAESKGIESSDFFQIAFMLRQLPDQEQFLKSVWEVADERYRYVHPINKYKFISAFPTLDASWAYVKMQAEKAPLLNAQASAALSGTTTPATPRTTPVQSVIVTDQAAQSSFADSYTANLAAYGAAVLPVTSPTVPAPLPAPAFDWKPVLIGAGVLAVAGAAWWMLKKKR